MASICCSPPDIVPAVWRRRSASRGNSANTSCKVCFALPRARGSSAPTSRFSWTVRLGNTWRPSATWPMPRLAVTCESFPVMSWPRNVILPARGRSMPAMARISDDLPAPFAPIERDQLAIRNLE